jgi:adenylate kinase
MNENCILTFVVGVSGVGKTEMIKHFVANHHDYVHIEASKLIKQGINAQTTEQIRLLPKEQIIKNQSLLLKELSKYKQKHQRIILDGQLIIYNNQELVPIPLDVVKNIAPHNLVLIQGNAQDIISHRINDPHKNRPNQTVDEIEKNQQFLEQMAINYCKEICIRFDKLCFNEYNKFTELLTKNV